MRVDALRMPVQSATDLMIAKILVLNEHYCDLARLFAHVRALHEQIDRPELMRAVAVRPAFLQLCDDLGLLPADATAPA